jgi:hypothetical protein
MIFRKGVGKFDAAEAVDGFARPLLVRGVASIARNPKREVAQH